MDYARFCKVFEVIVKILLGYNIVNIKFECLGDLNSLDRKKLFSFFIYKVRNLVEAIGK